MNFKVFDATPIQLSHFNLETDLLLEAAERANSKMEYIHKKTPAMKLDVFSVIDFRVLSGLIGETFITELASVCPNLKKNPNLDGYPDLVQVSTNEMMNYFKTCASSDFIKYKYGGIEVKNTFGTKGGAATILQGDSRIGNINKKLDWKAHHQETNNLIGLFSDYFDGLPKIAGIFFSNSLTRDDWSAVQRPKEGSAMTSFTSISATGYKKMISGVKACVEQDDYLNFFNLLK